MLSGTLRFMTAVFTRLHVKVSTHDINDIQFPEVETYLRAAILRYRKNTAALVLIG